MNVNELINNQYFVMGVAAVLAYVLIPGVRAFVTNLTNKLNPPAPGSPPAPVVAPVDPGPLPTNLAALLPWLAQQLIPQLRTVVKEEIANRPPIAGSTPAGTVNVVNNPDGSTAVNAPGVSVVSAPVKAA